LHIKKTLKPRYGLVIKRFASHMTFQHVMLSSIVTTGNAKHKLGVPRNIISRLPLFHFLWCNAGLRNMLKNITFI